MACYYPIDAWWSKNPNDNGNRYLVFTRREASQDEPLKVPCGNCIGCRLQKSQEWGIRCMHEMREYEQNCFITLTYDDEHLPLDNSVHKSHFRTFMKNLRQNLMRDGKTEKIRYFACGEYGTDQDINSVNTLGRPHYHAIIFGHDFEDKTLFKTIRDNPVYTSEYLSNVWKKGHVTVQEANFKTAQYTAGYCVKKIGGHMAETHYQRINQVTGEITNLHPEFMACSTGNKETKGIGSRWARRYLSDLDKGFITNNGDKIPYPKYYNQFIIDRENEAFYSQYQFQQDDKVNRVDSLDRDFTLDRLRVKEQVKILRTNKLTERNNIQ